MKHTLEDYLQLADEMIRKADTMYESLLGRMIKNHINEIQQVMQKYITFINKEKLKQEIIEDEEF